jgi:hypothetical protein
MESGIPSALAQELAFNYGLEYELGRGELVGIKDVNLTWEWFGGSKYNGVVSEALFPYPWFLITPKVWRVFRDAGVTGSTSSRCASWSSLRSSSRTSSTSAST